MKKALPFCALLLTVCLLSGCAPSQVPVSVATEAPTAAATEEPTAEPAAEPTAAPDPGPTAEYDAKTRKLTVTGTGDYNLLSLPDGTEAAVTLNVEDDDFYLSVRISDLPLQDETLSSFLPAFLSRTELSFCFLRTYLSETCGDLLPAELAVLPLALDTGNYNFGYRVKDGRLELTDTGKSGFIHREWLYLLAMMSDSSVGWEQYGYAWYVGTCLDPYSESPGTFKATSLSPVVNEWPYKNIMQSASINTEAPTASDVRAYYDAVSRFCFDLGLTGWGSTCESRPVTAETFYARTDTDAKMQDKTISAFMAASLIGWLDDQYGSSAISAFCFGRKTFDEAFGTDFDTEFAAWKAWIIETYPMN